MTESEFRNSRVFSLLCDVNTKMWIEPFQMSDIEKKNNPSWECVGGFLKDIPYKEDFQNAWGNWSEANRNQFLSLPNFDAEIFEQITGVKING